MDVRSSRGPTGLSHRARALGGADDERLVDGLRRRDETAFLALLQRHQGAMLRLARYHVASDATAEDVVQETWIAILHGIDGFDGRATLKTWMYRILTNRAKTAGQREGRSTPDSRAVEREVDRTAPAVAADRFLDVLDGSWPGHWRQPPLEWEVGRRGRGARSVARVVADAIELLSPTQRLVITLRDAECWSAAEVCNVLSLSETNQRVLLHRARTKVRAHLERHFQDAEPG